MRKGVVLVGTLCSSEQHSAGGGLQMLPGVVPVEEGELIANRDQPAHNVPTISAEQMLGLLSSTRTIMSSTDSIHENHTGIDSDVFRRRLSNSSSKLSKDWDDMPAHRRHAGVNSYSFVEGKLPKSKSFSQLSELADSRNSELNQSSRRISTWLEKGAKAALAQTTDGLHELTKNINHGLFPVAHADSVDHELVDWEESEIERQLILKRLHYAAVQSPPGKLDQKLQKLSDMLTFSNQSSWVHAPKPLSALLCKLPFQVVLVLLGVFWLFFGSSAAQMALREDYTQTRHVKFTPLELRSGGDVLFANVVEVGVLFNGCRYVDEVASSRVAEPSVQVTYEQLVDANGWYFITDNIPTSLDPVRFRFEMSTDGVNWTQVGSSSYTWHYFGKLYVDGYGLVSVKRNHMHAFPLGPPWPWKLDSIVCSLLIASSLFAAALLGYSGHATWGKMGLIFTMGCCSVLHLVAAIGMISQQTSPASFLYWTRVVLDVAAAYVLAREETLVVELLMVGGLFLFFCEMVHVFVIYSSSHLLGPTPFFGLAIAFLGIWLRIYRSYQFYKVRQGIRDDKRQYDEVWASLTKDNSEEKTLSEISFLANRLKQTTSQSDSLHQCRRAYTDKRPSRRTSVFSRGTSKKVSPQHFGLIDPYAHVTSLDQLMLAAHGLDPFLKRKVKEWAEISGGKFPLRGQQSVSFVRWDESMQGPDKMAVRSKIAWATVKDPERALEKLLTSYRGVCLYVHMYLFRYVCMHSHM